MDADLVRSQDPEGDAMACSAGRGCSQPSLVMKSMKDWKVTVPCPLGSTRRVMMRANWLHPEARVRGNTDFNSAGS